MANNNEQYIVYKSKDEVEVVKELPEPVLDLAQLAHVEIYSPKIEESVKFFTELLGLEITAEEGQSVYLRAYEEHYHHSLKVTEHKHAGLGHAAWRARTPQALMRRVEQIKSTGLGKGWIEGDLGHGPAYQFTTPDGHLMEMFFDVEYTPNKEGTDTELLNRARKRPKHGVPVKRIDHINLMTADPETHSRFLIDNLGFRLTEKIVGEEKTLGTWLSLSNIVHEIAFMNDKTDIKGRLHHICYWYGVPGNLFDLADLCKEYGIEIELGPRKHSISQAFCMYVYEPGGNRVELFGDTGYLIFDPTWKPPIWSDLQIVNDRGLGADFTESYYIYGTPHFEEK